MKIKLFGMWNDYTANVEVTRYNQNEICIVRPFSSSQMTLTVAQAKRLVEALQKCIDHEPEPDGN